MKRLLLAGLLAASTLARAEATLPANAGFTDESGRAVRLLDYLGDQPLVIVPGYFECQNLCGTLMDGVLEALAQSGLPSNSYRLLAVSIDPREDAATAQRRMAAFRPIFAREVDAHFLTGPAASAEALAASLDFRFEWDAAHAQYIHPAAFVVATPDGRIARRFDGVRFEARDLRLALVEASAGRVGSAGDRLLLMCSHYDPVTGRYSFAAMTAVRAAGLLAATALGGWLWRRRGGRA
ncbi:MAG: SCO family protein [Ignavibacteria bacterium]